MAAQCPHKSNSLPPWKSESRQDKIRTIMQSHMSTFIREQLGRVNSEAEHVFASFLPDLRQAPRYNLKNTPRRIDIGIDPSGCGSSEYSIVSTVVEEGRRVVRILSFITQTIVSSRGQPTNPCWGTRYLQGWWLQIGLTRGSKSRQSTPRRPPSAILPTGLYGGC